MASGDVLSHLQEIAMYYARHVDDYVGSFNMVTQLRSPGLSSAMSLPFVCHVPWRSLSARPHRPRFAQDSDLSPQLKESWTRRMSPSEEFVASYQPQPPLTPVDIAPLWSPDKAQLEALLTAAGALGPLIHYRQTGFAANLRTQRMAGLAILEAAQAARAAVAGFRSGEQVKVQNAGSSAVFESRDGEHQFGWRDLFDIIVKWRQLTEPNDAVSATPEGSLSCFLAAFNGHGSSS